MALISINNVAVISGTITMPKIGVWSADLVVDQIDGTGFSDGTKVTITTGDMTLVGVVAPSRTGNFLDTVHVRVLGGAGGLGKASTPRSYVQPGAYVRDVLSGLASDSGETLSSTIATAFTGQNLTAWSTMANTVSWNLRALLKWLGAGFSWRILPDGTLWMGTESWARSTGTFDILESQPAEGTFTLGCESPFITPGMSLTDVGNVNRVEHQIKANKIRSVVSVDLPEGDRGLSGSIARLVASQTTGFDYYALYQCQVVSQSADLTTVDVQFQGANKAKIAGLSRVPVRAGTGIKIKVATGSTMLLSWDGGNPQLPYACLGLSSDTAQSIQLAGNTPAARKGDAVGAGTIVFAFAAGTGAATLSVTYNPGDGSAPQVLGAGSGTLTIKELITAGSSVVGLG